jgi:two-component system, cell cycle response regulator CpdR
MAKILLAEDDNLTRSTLAKFLQASGYDVALAANGMEALSLLNKQEFDLVLSDVVMPNVNGWDLLDHVSSVSPQTPIVLMTAFPAAQSRKSQSDLRPDLVLKPLVLADLLAKIQKLLDQKKS